MKLRSGMLCSTSSVTEAWPIQPTRIERAAGRLLRGPDDPDPDLPAADPPVAYPPVEPPADPPTAVDPPADPPKPADPEPEPAAVEPLTVEALAAPEGFEIEPAMAEDFLKIVNDGEMDPKDKANALIALHAKTITAASEASSVAFDEMQTKWRDEVKADPDIGGAKLQPTIANVGKLLDEFGNAELKEVFDFTGAGNNIHVIKFLNVIADKLTEGKFFTGGSPSKSDDPDAAARRMYPSATK